MVESTQAASDGSNAIAFTSRTHATRFDPGSTRAAGAEFLAFLGHDGAMHYAAARLRPLRPALRDRTALARTLPDDEMTAVQDDPA